VRSIKQSPVVGRRIRSILPRFLLDLIDLSFTHTSALLRFPQEGSFFRGNADPYRGAEIGMPRRMISNAFLPNNVPFARGNQWQQAGAVECCDSKPCCCPYSIGMKTNGADTMHGFSLRQSERSCSLLHATAPKGSGASIRGSLQCLALPQENWDHPHFGQRP
jgi:hypothetical protein